MTRTVPISANDCCTIEVSFADNTIASNSVRAVNRSAVLSGPALERRLPVGGSLVVVTPLEAPRVRLRQVHTLRGAATD